MTSNPEIPTNGARALPWLFLVMLTVLLSTAILLTAIPRTWAAEDTLEVYQQAGHKVFGQNTNLDIFDEYISKLDGHKLIDPYSEGTYVFAVHNNTDSYALPYALEVEAVNPGNVPIVVSIEKNGKYIYGGSGESNMLPCYMLQFDSMLDGHETDIFTLRWAWDGASDAVDTQIGTSGPVYYTLIITARGVTGETEIEPPKTGDPSHGIIWAIVMLSSMSIPFIIYIKRRKKKGEDSQTAFENI